MTAVIDYPSPVPLSHVCGGDRQTEKALYRSIRAFLRDGGTIWRDRGRVLLRHDKQDRATVLAASLEALERLCVPAVTEEQAALTRAVLEAAGTSAAYIDDPNEAALAVLALRDACRAERAEHGRAAIGLDMETEVMPELHSEVLVKFTQAGAPAKRQPKEGAAGLALDPYSSRVRLCQLWAGRGAVRVFDMRAVPWSVLDLLLDDPSINWAAFAATFEAKRLLVERGHTPAGRLFDTRTAIWLTHGRLPDLEEAAQRVFGLTVPKALGASDWSVDTLTREQIEYAALDSVLACALWHEQRNHFEADDPEAEVAQRVADNAIEAVARAELHGVGFERDTHARMVAGWHAELQEHEAARATAVPGFDWRNRQALQDHLAANLSEAELDRWPRTKTGLLGTRRTTLVQAKHVAGITEHLEVKRLAKLLDTFGESLPVKINPQTGRLHTALLIAGARSGRFSSRAPNLQQMPKLRSPVFRRVFVAGEGKLLMAADYSQIELRAVAETLYATIGYSSMRDGFTEGLDAHLTTALHLTGKNDPDAVTKEERNQAKPANFGLVYGMSARGFYFYVRDQYQPDITEAEAFDLYEATHAAYPELAEWHAFQEAQCRADGYVSTPLGRRWHWHWLARDEDEIDYDRGFIEDQRSGFYRNYSFNHPIQGGCAEVILIATARVDRALRGLPARIALSVHDELLIELAADPQVIADARTIVCEEMTAAFLHVFPDAPTLGLVEPTIGRSWGEQVPVDDWLQAGGEVL
jgi:DNA polymerase-1